VTPCLHPRPPSLDTAPDHHVAPGTEAGAGQHAAAYRDAVGGDDLQTPPDVPGDLPTDLPADAHADVPGTPDLPADPGEADPGATDPGSPDVPPVDVPLTPEPWVQCTDDAPCKAAFGEYATCNLDFPGGQCMGCDPEAPGVHVKCTSLSHDLLDVTLSCRMANGGVCLYDCPCPSWLRCLENEQLCILKTCATDADCGPFSCRPIDVGGTSYCLPPK